MKKPRLLIALGSAICATAVAAAAAPTLPAKPSPAMTPPALSKYQQAQQERFRDSAPADEYFGRLKLSYLGMNNTFRDAAMAAGEQTTDRAIVAKIEFAEDALADWGRKYPRDPQLARTYFLATQVDRKIWIETNQERAWTYLNRIVTIFPDSYFGKIVKTDLARGFTEHYYADAVPCPVPSSNPQTPSPEPPSPTPTATTTPTPTPRRGAHPTPTPSPTPSPSPTPTLEPTPLPTPTLGPPILIHKGPGHNVQIEPSACRMPVPDASSPASPTASPSSVPATAPPAASSSPTALPTTTATTSAVPSASPSPPRP